MKIVFETSEALREQGLVSPRQPDTVEIEIEDSTYGFGSFVQITYDFVRVGPDGDHIGRHDHENGCWYLFDPVYEGMLFSDIIIAE